MMVNPLELLQTIKNAAADINKNEKLAIPLLANRAYKEAQLTPNDQTLRLLANVLGKMNNNGKIFITKGEFKDLYNKFSSRSTRAFEVFANELDIVEPTMGQIAGKEAITELDMSSCADPKIANALSELWNEKGTPAKHGTINVSDPRVEKQAETITCLELARHGYGPKTVKTFGGSEEHIVCDAVYETPKGEAHILVPVEISKSGVMIPSTLISKHGIVSLNSENLKETIIASAGKNVFIDSNVLLKSLASMDQVKDLSDFELRALIAQEKLDEKTFTKEACDKGVKVDGPMTLGELYSEDGAPLELDGNKKEVEAFASKLSNSVGVAEFTFGKRAVDAGKNIILSKISSFGYKPQVSVSSVCDDSIIYAVGCDTRNGPVGFEVVVDIKNNKPIMPSILAVNDSVFEFNKEGFEKIIANQFSDPKMVAAVSPSYGLKPSELVSIIREAADRKNYKEAEDALNVLSETASPELYSKGLLEYMRCFDSEMNKTASKPCGCTKIVRSKNHEEAMCGHLNLPLSKVAQDETGRCIPKYRQGMEDTYEGAMFSTSKILL